MKEIIKKFLEWKGDNDENHVYDQIHDFFSTLSRGEMTSMVSNMIQNENVSNDKIKIIKNHVESWKSSDENPYRISAYDTVLDLLKLI